MLARRTFSEISVAVLLAMIFNGCTTVPLSRRQIDAISRETGAVELDGILGAASVIAQYDLSVNGQSYFVRYYICKWGKHSNLLTCVRRPAL